MTKNILYVGMMWDITTALNLEDFDKIYVMDSVDLTYGQFIEGKQNSFETLKEKIKNILVNGYYYEKYYNVNQYIKYGKAKIIEETEDKICNHPTEFQSKWNLKFIFEETDKMVELIFYAGYMSDYRWPDEIKNISTIITIGSGFYECEDVTTKYINERCTTPFTYYKLYFNCYKSKFEKIGEKLKHNNLQIKNVLFLSEIGKTVVIDKTNMLYIKYED